MGSKFLNKNSKRLIKIKIFFHKYNLIKRFDRDKSLSSLNLMIQSSCSRSTFCLKRGCKFAQQRKRNFQAIFFTLGLVENENKTSFFMRGLETTNNLSISLHSTFSSTYSCMCFQ